MPIRVKYTRIRKTGKTLNFKIRKRVLLNTGLATLIVYLSFLTKLAKDDNFIYSARDTQKTLIVAVFSACAEMFLSSSSPV